MYLLQLDPSHGTGETISDVLKTIIDVTVTKVADGGFEVRYQLAYCEPCKHTVQYSSEYTEEEVYADFYRTKGIEIANTNGYVLFKEVK